MAFNSDEEAIAAAQAPLASSQGKSQPPLVALAKPKPPQLSAEAPLQVKPQVKPQSPPGALPPHMHTYMYPKPQAYCLERGLQIAGPGYIDHRTSGLPAFVPGKRPAPQPPPAKTVPLASSQGTSLKQPPPHAPPLQANETPLAAALRLAPSLLETNPLPPPSPPPAKQPPPSICFPGDCVLAPQKTGPAKQPPPIICFPPHCVLAPQKTGPPLKAPPLSLQKAPPSQNGTPAKPPPPNDQPLQEAPPPLKAPPTTAPCRHQPAPQNDPPKEFKKR